MAQQSRGGASRAALRHQKSGERQDNNEHALVECRHASDINNHRASCRHPHLRSHRHCSHYDHTIHEITRPGHETTSHYDPVEWHLYLATSPPGLESLDSELAYT